MSDPIPITTTVWARLPRIRTGVVPSKRDYGLALIWGAIWLFAFADLLGLILLAKEIFHAIVSRAH